MLPSKLPAVNGRDTLPAAKPSGGEEMEAAQAATVSESPPDTGDRSQTKNLEKVSVVATRRRGERLGQPTGCRK